MDYFIRLFTVVSVAIDWEPSAIRFQLREILKDTASDFGQAEEVADIFAALKTRFGVTAREAMSRLTSLRKKPKATLAEHAAEVKKLVGVA